MKNKIKPAPGQESVWDYPRPPRLEKTSKHIKIFWHDHLLASTNQAYRVLETSHPPVYYLPQEDLEMSLLKKHAGQRTFCEWKGSAEYWDIISPEGKSISAAWSYPSPNERFAPIEGYLAFYPSRVTSCFVNDEQVQAQEGDFYGGWITSDIVGPFKGSPGTWGW
jgi:uncharacterized protein (DUF427 family)